MFLVGSVINKIKEKSFWESTVILLWSDHGYKLGALSDYELTNLPNSHLNYLQFKINNMAYGSDLR